MRFAEYWARLRRSWSGKPPEEHEQQLMQLYWNRAELKKELANQQSQRATLADKLRVQEAATKRAIEQQEQLHAYLGNPEHSANALVYFQLRALWKLCSDMLAKFAADLRRQQEDRERQRYRLECESQRSAQLSAINEQLLNAQSLVASLQARIHLLVNRRAELGRSWFLRLWNYRRRREVAKELAHLQAQRHTAAAQARDYIDERSQLAATPFPEFSGLSLEGRRLINTATLAYVEFLLSLLPHRGLTSLAKDAMSVQVYDIRFGGREECARLMALTKTALQSLPEQAQDLVGLKNFTDRMRARVAYRSNEDPVPIAESVQDTSASMPVVSESNSLEVKTESLNVLVEDYFGVTALLTR